MKNAALDGIKNLILTTIMAFVVLALAAAVSGCSHQHQAPTVKKVQTWKKPASCRTVDKVITKNVAIIIQHSCLAKNVVTAAVVFLRPVLRKNMNQMVEQAVQAIVSRTGRAINVHLITMGRDKGRSFFLFVLGG